MKLSLDDLLQTEALVTRSQHPHLAAALSRRCSRGLLDRLAPGVYGPSNARNSLPLRALAASLAWPDAVITGRTAAALTWWPELPADTIVVARKNGGDSFGSFKVERRAVNGGHITWRGQVAITCPALTVLDLIPSMGGNVIDEALRRRAVTLTALRGTLAETPGRRGNAQREELVEDSRDLPWSEPERFGQRHLRQAHITGWRTNVRVALGRTTMFLDIAFERELLAIEIDGWAYHNSRSSFEADRARDARLIAHGWTVLRFTAAQVDDEQAFIATITATLARLRRR